MNTKLLAILALALVLLVIVRGLMERNRLAASRINLDDLVIGDDGKISKAAVVMFVALICTTWVVCFMTLNNRMTEGYFAAYGAFWIAPIMAKIFKGPTPVATTETTLTERTSTPQGPTT